MASAGRQADGHAVVLFDGGCALCSAAAVFIVKRDRRGRFRFAALGSKAGEGVLSAAGVGLSGLPDSMVLVEGGRVWVKSDAALRIAKGLQGLWPVLAWGLLLPRALRDAVYDAVAARRREWFGGGGACAMPGEAVKARFLEERGGVTRRAESAYTPNDGGFGG